MKKLALLALLALAACDDKAPAKPLPPVQSDAGVPAPAAATRTVGHRHPFGDALQADNLVLDGDFEVTGRNDQAPWIVYNKSQQTLNYDTGGRCRSGIRCAVIATGDALVGYMATPPVADIDIRAYIKPDGDRCADAQLFVFDLASNNTSAAVQPLTTNPDVDGWCVFEGTAASNVLVFQQPALYVQLADKAKSTMLHVDQVSALPVGEAPVHGIKAPLAKPSAADVARMTAAATWIRTHRKFGGAPRSTP